MAKMSLGDKASRVLKLLMGLRNPRVANAMAAYGFTDEDQQDGWKLLQSTSRAKLDVKSKGVSSDTLDKLDAWENRWFPIASATLERRHPDVHAEVFKNLSQTSGPAVAVSVQTLLDRLEEMSAAKSAYGPNGKKAKALLEQRGLTKPVINEAKALLESIGTFDLQPELATHEQDQEALASAEAELWSWYLEWSRIARVAVTQRALLRQMGFIQTQRASGDTEEPPPDEPSTPATPPVTPVVTPPATPTSPSANS